MVKKQYQKPNFVSKAGKNVNVAPGALAAAAAAAANTMATSSVKKAFSSGINEDASFSLAPIKIITV